MQTNLSPFIIHEITEILEFQTQPIGNVTSNPTSKCLRVYKFTNRQQSSIPQSGQEWSTTNIIFANCGFSIRGQLMNILQYLHSTSNQLQGNSVKSSQMTILY